MKNVLKYILFLMIPMCCFPSCSGGDEPVVIEPSIEFLDGNDVYQVETEGGTFNVKFVSTKEWTAVSNSVWCKVSESGGEAGTVTLTLTVEPNEEFESRDAIITLRSEQIKKQFLVKQAERGAVFVSMKHTNWDYFALPVFSGENLSGTVSWGDGQQEDLQNDASHSYSEEKEYTVTVELKGASKVAWQDIVGLTEIDLSAF